MTVHKSPRFLGRSCHQPTRLHARWLEKEICAFSFQGAYAADLLGLSEQVPLKLQFLTDGASRTVQIDNQTIALKHATPKNMVTAGRISGFVI